MTTEEILKIDVFESYPRMYTRIPVTLTMTTHVRNESFDMERVEEEVVGLAYVMNDISEF